MTPAELDELERVLRSKALEGMEEDDSEVLLRLVPRLIAKVRAADALALEAVETKLSYSTGPVVVAAAAYRKAQP